MRIQGELGGVISVVKASRDADRALLHPPNSARADSHATIASHLFRIVACDGKQAAVLSPRVVTGLCEPLPAFMDVWERSPRCTKEICPIAFVTHGVKVTMGRPYKHTRGSTIAAGSLRGLLIALAKEAVVAAAAGGGRGTPGDITAARAHHTTKFPPDPPLSTLSRPFAAL